jgi:hypothetical protein
MGFFLGFMSTDTEIEMDMDMDTDTDNNIKKIWTCHWHWLGHRHRQGHRHGNGHGHGHGSDLNMDMTMYMNTKIYYQSIELPTTGLIFLSFQTILIIGLVNEEIHRIFGYQIPNSNFRTIVYWILFPTGGVPTSRNRKPVPIHPFL